MSDAPTTYPTEFFTLYAELAGNLRMARLVDELIPYPGDERFIAERRRIYWGSSPRPATC